MRYAIVYFGTPSVIRRGSATLDAAISVARSAKGTGSCSCARVYACDTLALARTADISVVSPGERVAFKA
jgi:hypothetical protein